MRLQPSGETAVASGELAGTLLQRGVLDGGPLNGFAGEFASGRRGADRPAVPVRARWGADLGVGILEDVVGVERPRPS